MILNLQVGVPHLIAFFMRLVADPWTGRANLNPEVLYSLNGNAFQVCVNAAAEIGGAGNGHGWYVIVLTPGAELAAVGVLAIHANDNAGGALAKPYNEVYQVVSFNPEDAAAMGLTNLNATVGSRSVPGDQMALVANAITAAKIQDGAITAAKVPNLDSTVGSRATQGSADYITQILQNKLIVNKVTSKLELYDNAGVAVIKTWDLLDKDGNAIVLQGTGPVKRSVPY